MKKNNLEIILASVAVVAILLATGLWLAQSNKNAGEEAAVARQEESAEEARKMAPFDPSADSGASGNGAAQGTDVPGEAASGDPADGQRTEISKEQREAQLAELSDYWAKGDMAAVADVIRLDRNARLSALLDGTDDFYYYGDLSGDGLPEGTGLAVYGDGQFYYGGWLDGARSGRGKWIKVYQYEDDVKEEDRLYFEHTYDGEWADDLPNGQGQEHFDIDASKISDNLGCVQNVIGGFRDGLYDGDMYILRLYEDGSVREWDGSAENGVWQPYGKPNVKGQYPVNVRRTNEDNYIWCLPQDNAGNGVEGMHLSSRLLQ